MNDPIETVILMIAQDKSIQEATERNILKPNFLNNVAEVFETHGFETTRIYLLDKKNQSGLHYQAEALLAALRHMEGCPAINQRRAIGRTIIKTLPEIGRSYQNIFQRGDTR